MNVLACHSIQEGKRPGDMALLLESGPKRAIRAVMRIDASPAEVAEFEHEQAFWHERDTERRCRVLGTLTHRVAMPIEDLKAIDDLKDLSIFHGFQQGTNFRVSEAEGSFLLALATR